MMDSATREKMKAAISESIGRAIPDIVEEHMARMLDDERPVPRPVEDAPAPTPHITVFEWSRFAGDPTGVYTGTKTAWPTPELSLKHDGPHKSAIVYDAMGEELRVWGDRVPRRIKLGASVVSMGMLPDGSYRGALSRDGFREVLLDSIESIQTHWSAVLDGFDRLPPLERDAA